MLRLLPSVLVLTLVCFGRSSWAAEPKQHTVYAVGIVIKKLPNGCRSGEYVAKLVTFTGGSDKAKWAFEKELKTQFPNVETDDPYEQTHGARFVFPGDTVVIVQYTKRSTMPTCASRLYTLTIGPSYDAAYEKMRAMNLEAVEFIESWPIDLKVTYPK